MLAIDRVTEIGIDGGKFGEGKILAELNIQPTAWFFDGHFLGDPVMPGCLGLETMWQLISYWLLWSGASGEIRGTGIGKVRFGSAITPRSKFMQYEIDIRASGRGRRPFAIAAGYVIVDGEYAFFADDIQVGLIS